MNTNYMIYMMDTLSKYFSKAIAPIVAVVLSYGGSRDVLKRLSKVYCLLKSSFFFSLYVWVGLYTIVASLFVQAHWTRILLMRLNCVFFILFILALSSSAHHNYRQRQSEGIINQKQENPLLIGSILVQPLHSNDLSSQSRKCVMEVEYLIFSPETTHPVTAFGQRVAVIVLGVLALLWSYMEAAFNSAINARALTENVKAMLLLL